MPSGIFRKKSPPTTKKASSIKDSIPTNTDLEKNLVILTSIFKDDATFAARCFENRSRNPAKFCLVYFKGMVKDIFLSDLVNSIQNATLQNVTSPKELLRTLKDEILPTGGIKTVTDLNEVTDLILHGETALFIDGLDSVLIVPVRLLHKRDIEEALSATTPIGPKDGFVESLFTNLTLIRRRINSIHLKFKFKTIGKRTKTKICIGYMKNLALEDILAEVERRLDAIDMDGVLDSGYIQEMIRDAPYSPFQTVGAFERPDVVASKLLEGRIAIFVDGSPFVLTVPYIIAETVQASDDYYQNFYFASFNRFMRNFAMFAAILIPAGYLSLITYHQEIIPTPLFVSIAQAREGVPLPAVIELILTVIIFDLLREVSTRMIPQISNTMSFVGTLVLGEVLVQAKFISAPIVIVTALTGILTLMNYSMAGATTVTRLVLLFSGAMFGIYGTLSVMFLVVLHILSIRSFGVPYMLNITRLKNHNFQDVWIRAPWRLMTMRPKVFGMKNLTRQTTEKNQTTRHQG